jgi:HAD superfamily hydrolase (TIGR01450 family)
MADVDTAVVLAAGIGSRLRPTTLELPKVCIPVGGRSILARQLAAYADAGVSDVVVVAGYLPDRTRAISEAIASDRDGLEITVVENDRYANTNNLYSLYQAREQLAGDPFLLSNGDVVFDPSIVETLLDEDADSAIACDYRSHSDEAMKVTVDADGTVDHIAKDVPPDAAHAVSIDLYRFSSAFSTELFDRASRLFADGEYDVWTEVAIDAVVEEYDVEPVDIGRRRWVEIDDEADLRVADRTFGSFSLSETSAVFVDLDGTLYLGDSLVDGADEAVEALRDAGVDVYFLSNNSSAWKPEYVEKLRRLGVAADPEHVVLSTDGVITYLEENGIERTYVVGTAAMREAIADRGVAVEADDPESVVVGFDRELTYEKVREATLAIRDGAEFLLAHGDHVCPTGEGFVPDCGAIGALVGTATDRDPTRVFGKPDPEMIDHVLESEGLAPEDVAIVGDRLSTEIRMAENVGCQSACVLTGDATRPAIATSEVQPSVVLDDVSDLLSYVEEA